MPFLRRYRVFISHAWHRDEAYWRVVGMLDAAPHFQWDNLSVPEHNAIDPYAGGSIAYHLHGFMRRAHVFILCAGLYVSHSEWIDHEVRFARRIGRPIIAVRAWGAQRLPASAANANEIVGRQDSLIAAIRRLALPEHLAA